MDTVKIHIDVDEATAIRMGKRFYGDAVIEINPADLTDAQREVFARCDKKRIGDNYVKSPFHTILLREPNTMLPRVSEATIDTAKLLLDTLEKWYSNQAVTLNARAAAEAAQFEADVQTVLNANISEFLFKDIYRWELKLPNNISYANHNIKIFAKDPRVDAKIAEAEAEIKRLNAELAAEREAVAAKRQVEREKAERLEAEKENQKKQQIAAWVEAKGTENQKKRAALNLLPDDEIINRIRDEAFAPLADFPRYKKLISQDVPCWCGEYDDDAPHADFSVTDAETATAEQFDVMEQIATLVPAARLTLRRHIGWCNKCWAPGDEDENIERYSIRVELTSGAFDFSREYAA